ncbi:MAG: transglutaminase domain-containing protein [Clostridia bacterium]|nr:transglutaminase domain-containing protein [Clostridia bacterium]
MFYEDAFCLALPLPEDIQHLKHYGDYDRLVRVLDLRIADEKLPQALRRRLQMEKRIIERIPGAYPYTFDAALALLQKEIRGVTAQELEEFRDRGMVDWIYLNGEVRFQNSFLSTLIKVRPELEERVLNPERLAYKKTNAGILDDTVREMQNSGGAARRWHMRHALRIKQEFVREGKEILVHLPLPVEYDCVRGFRLLNSGPVPGYVSDPYAPQRTISFRKPLAEKDVFFAEYEFETHMRWTAPDPDLAKGGFPADQPDALAEQPPHISFSPLIRETAREIAEGEKNPLILARRVYDFLTKRPIYSYVRSYFTYPDLPAQMLTGMKGDCGIFALSFITLCRYLGVPARWQSGLYCAPHDVGCHDWAQFYCEPWGWLPVDASFGNATWHAGSALRHEFYFGNLDPFRLPAARAFQAPFDPPKAHLRSDPYDNQSGEAEYPDMGLMSSQFEEKCEMLEWQAIPYGANEGADRA